MRTFCCLLLNCYEEHHGAAESPRFSWPLLCVCVYFRPPDYLFLICVKIVKSLLQKQDCELPDEDVVEIVMKTDGYSGADMANLCREAALGPIRSLQVSNNFV